SLPVTVPQMIGDDDVDRLSQGLDTGKAQNALGTLVPELHHAVGVDVDDRVAGMICDRLMKVVNDWRHRRSLRSDLRPFGFQRPEATLRRASSACLIRDA